jgi:hypothetical protein
MKLTVLQFPSVEKLWRFRQAIDSNAFEVNLKNKTLSCQCHEHQIQLAIREFGATVIEGTQQDEQRK